MSKSENSVFVFSSFDSIIETEEKAIKFCEDFKLVPNRQSIPPLCCGQKMKVENAKNKKLGWVWRCSTTASKKKGSKDCRNICNPCDGTFFDGSMCRISIREVLTIIIGFIAKWGVHEIHKSISEWRNKTMSLSTIVDYYGYCREVAQIIMSNEDIRLGGPGKSIQMNEVFLTKRKYNRGKGTSQMILTIIGIFCKEDKECLFFHVNTNNISDIWSCLMRYIDEDTKILYKDHKIELSQTATHFQTSSSKKKVINRLDKDESRLDDRNCLLDNNIKCRKSPKRVHENMTLHLYRQHRLEKKNKLGYQLMTFLDDIKKVYPPFLNGKRDAPLMLQTLNVSTVESKELTNAISTSSKKQRIPTIDELIDIAMDSSDDEKELSFETIFL